MTPAPAAAVSSRRIVVADAVGTGLFVVTAVLAAAIFTTAFQWIGAVCALALFVVGVFTFLWSYFHAVNRSRTDEIGVAQLYLLTGPPTPREIRRPMLALLGVQIATALATTFARLDGPDGKPGSSLAVGFLVAMFGLGLNGLWAAFHGTFPPRRRREATPAVSDEPDVPDDADESPSVPDVEPAISKNDPHG